MGEDVPLLWEGGWSQLDGVRLATKDYLKTAHKWKTLVLFCGYPVQEHLHSKEGRGQGASPTNNF